MIGDFNEDGAPDLLLYGENNASTNMLQVQIFASAPGGKFVTLPLQNLSLPGGFPIPVPALLDVNGDSHLDLLFGNMVAYGKGDGTFGTPATLPILASGFSQTYAVDVTGDGKLDIVAVNTPPNPATATGTVQFSFTVFRNDGSGTFTSLGSFPLAASLPQGSYSIFNIFGLSFADMNGDGRLDVLSQSNGVPPVNAAAADNVYTMLNNGDGTFAAPIALDTSATLSIGSDAITFGDLNGDGKIDLVLAYSPQGQGNWIGSALGNGDGTFGPVQQLDLDPKLALAVPQFVQLGDYNLDGKVDAVVGSGQLALGNGDGTFTLSNPLFPPPNSEAPLSYPLLEASLVPQSLPSFVFVDLVSGANAVFTPVDASSATTNLTLSAGMHSLTAHYSGDANYAATVSPAVPLQISQAATTLTVTSSQNPSYVGGNPLITATVAGVLPNAGGTVTFTSGSTNLTMLPLKNGAASFNLDLPSTPGDFPITASYSGDANDAPASGNLMEAIEAPISIPAPAPGTTTLIVTSGSAAQGSITVSGATGYTGPLGLSCTGLPADASCSFIPQMPTIGSGPTTFMFYVATSSSALPLGQIREPSGSIGPQIAWCGVPLISTLLIGALRRYRAVILCLMVSVIVLTGINGCGGNSSKPPTGGQTSSTNTPPGNYTFQVNAYSSGVSASQTFTLVVQ